MITTTITTTATTTYLPITTDNHLALPTSPILPTTATAKPACPLLLILFQGLLLLLLPLLLLLLLLLGQTQNYRVWSQNPPVQTVWLTFPYGNFLWLIMFLGATRPLGIPVALGENHGSFPGQGELWVHHSVFVFLGIRLITKQMVAQLGIVRISNGPSNGLHAMGLYVRSVWKYCKFLQGVLKLHNSGRLRQGWVK